MDLLASAYSSEEEEESASVVTDPGEKQTPPSQRSLPSCAPGGTQPLPLPSCAPEGLSPPSWGTQPLPPPSSGTQDILYPSCSTRPLPLRPPGSARPPTAPIGYVSRRKRKHQEQDDEADSSTSIDVLSAYVPFSGPDPVDTSAGKQAKHTKALPRRTTKVLTQHTKAVLSLEWHPSDPRLLLSASLDGQVKLWHVESRKDSCVSTYRSHGGAAVRDVEWITCERALSAGYDCTAVHTDIRHCKEITRLRHSAFISVVKPHPSDENLVLTGDHDGGLRTWDLRQAGHVREYRGAGGKILDAVFLPDGGGFVASADIVRRNSFSQAMNIWDFDSGVTLTHQLYFEPFTCPCLRMHGSRAEFLAQSNGNYVVLFSARKPFKMNKRKRFQGHTVSGFDVGFDMDLDGSVLCSASSEGKVHFYDYTSSKMIRTLSVTDSAGLAVTWSCSFPYQVGVSDWNGKIHILQ